MKGLKKVASYIDRGANLFIDSKVAYVGVIFYFETLL